MTWIKVMRKSMIGVESKEIMAMFFGREMWRLEGKRIPIPLQSMYPFPSIYKQNLEVVEKQ